MFRLVASTTVNKAHGSAHEPDKCWGSKQKIAEVTKLVLATYAAYAHLLLLAMYHVFANWWRPLNLLFILLPSPFFPQNRLSSLNSEALPPSPHRSQFN